MSIDAKSEETPRFEVGSPESLAYLEENGYVVLANVASAEEVATAKDLFWQFLESIEERKIRRDDPRSWDAFPGWSGTGIIPDNGVGQSEFLWYLRGLPKVKEAFSSIWHTDQLLTSFDGCGVFRPWLFDEVWKTRSGWWHVDQNPIQKPTKCCIQGLISMMDANERTGNLCVLPGSHSVITKLGLSARSDFVPIPKQHEILKQIPATLVSCKAGDLVLWDSRLIHCNTPALETPLRPADDKWDVLRLVAYICMTPASRAKDLRELRRQRGEAFRNCWTTNHWPHEFHIAAKPQRTSVNKLKLNQHQLELLYGLEPGQVYKP